MRPEQSEASAKAGPSVLLGGEPWFPTQGRESAQCARSPGPIIRRHIGDADYIALLAIAATIDEAQP